MCRLYGFLATEPTLLECSLVEAQNALLVQSDRDRRGIRNPDGWGIAEWQAGYPLVTRNVYPAFADRRYVDTASTVNSHAVVAHVRAATVGSVAMENTHPFDNGTWVFAHNGTVSDIDHVATHLDLGSYGHPDGETDSELIFRWMLNRMTRHGLDPSRPADSLAPILDLVESAIVDLLDISIAAGASQPSQLNFMVSDGHHLVASRWGNSLYWLFRTGITDCNFCGSSHCPQAGDGYKAVAIASEPLTDEAWNEVPEGTMIGVTPELTTTTRSLAADIGFSTDMIRPTQTAR
jgi:predicted glutamine amidotransferase